MTRNPADYPEPEEFRPERFLTMQDGAYVRNKAVRNPATVVFGFGRRYASSAQRLPTPEKLIASCCAGTAPGGTSLTRRCTP